MPTLQEQSDSNFVAADTIQKERAAEEAASKVVETQDVQYAEDDGADDYPAPPPMESDGKPLTKAPASTEFADAVPEGGVHDGGEPPQAKPQRRDVHSSEEQSTGAAEIPDDLLARARNYGISDEVIRNRFGSAKELEDALLGIDQNTLGQFEQYQQQQRFYQQQQQRRPMPPPQQQPRQPQPQGPQIQPWQVSDPEVYDETLLNDLQGLSHHTQQHLASQQQELMQLRQAVGQMQQQQQYEAQRRETLDFDRQIQELGSEWEEVFGAGEADRLLSDSPEMRNRAQAYQTAMQFRWLGQQQGRRVTLKDVLPSALQHHFPQKNHHSRSQLRNQQGRFLARPTRRNNSPAGSGREEILNRWDRAYGDRGEVDDI